MRATRELAKQQIEVYGDLLIQHAVIDDIETTEKRGAQCFTFNVLDTTYPYPIECADVLELAKILIGMWSAYAKAWNDSGIAVYNV